MCLSSQRPASGPKRLLISFKVQLVSRVPALRYAALWVEVVTGSGEDPEGRQEQQAERNKIPTEVLMLAQSRYQDEERSNASRYPDPHHSIGRRRAAAIG